MKNTKIKGFSLAEVLISLTVVSILLAVAAPVITKQHVGDNTWKWTEGNTVKNGTSFDGNNLVIGSRTVPSADDVDDYFSSFPDGDIKTAAASDLFLNNNRLISKLSIIKPKQSFQDSHMSFYNIVSGDTEYAGRLASDKSNLALGIASLQTLQPNYIVYSGINNTAIGHYALSKNDSSLVQFNIGSKNVALGYGALANNKSGSNNTAVGYRALSNSDDNISNNTVIGNDINGNVKIIGDDNLIIGNYDIASEREWGSNNILIGNNAGSNIPTVWGNSNIFAIGNVNSVEKAGLLQSGVGETAELIENKLERRNSKKLVVNGDFVIRSADGSKTLFKVDGTGETISYNNQRDASKRKAVNAVGSNRCEGAEICIGKFNIPYVDCGILSPKTTSVEAYDIYVRNMSVGIYHNSIKDNQVPYLGAALLYLDRYKDTKGSLIGLLEKRENIFKEMFPGLSTKFDNVFDWILAAIGMSDARLKNIYGDSTAGLNEINALKVKDYTYKADKTKTPHVGVIAQELQKVFPNSVIEGSDGYLSITQEEMFFGLVNSIQELSDKNDNVSEKIALSKEQIEYTQKQNKLIEQENKLLERQNKEFAKRIAKLQKKKI